MAADEDEGEEDAIILDGADLTPGRVDRALADAAADISRARLKSLMRTNAVWVERGGAREALTNPSAKVDRDALYILIPPPPEPSPLTPEAIALTILHEDDAVIVVDKPPGLAVHPAPGTPSGTLVNALLHHCGESLLGVGGVARPGIVHRLDKDTSGVMVAAKTDAAHRALVEQFQARSVGRRYSALCRGAPRAPKGEVRGNIGRSPRDRKKMAVFADDEDAPGRHAVTHFVVEERFGDGAARLTCRLETGRTHQIRVHMAHIGLPLIGDPVYGRGGPLKGLGEAGARFPRQALHAARLQFVHPQNGHDLTFETAPPVDIQNLERELRDPNRTGKVCLKSPYPKKQV